MENFSVYNHNFVFKINLPSVILADYFGTCGPVSMLHGPIAVRRFIYLFMNFLRRHDF